MKGNTAKVMSFRNKRPSPQHGQAMIVAEQRIARYQGLEGLVCPLKLDE